MQELQKKKILFLHQKTQRRSGIPWPQFLQFLKSKFQWRLRIVSSSTLMLYNEEKFLLKGTKCRKENFKREKKKWIICVTYTSFSLLQLAIFKLLPCKNALINHLLVTSPRHPALKWGVRGLHTPGGHVGSGVNWTPATAEGNIPDFSSSCFLYINYISSVCACA